MTLTRKVRRLGGSLLISIPSHLAACLEIKEGTPLCIDVDQNKIVMAPLTRQDENGANQTK